MVQLSAYLNLLFDTGTFPERVDRVAELGYPGIEVYGFDQDLAEIAERRDDHGLDWVYLSGSRPDFTDPQNTEAALENIRESLELAEEYDIQNLNVKSGQTKANLTLEDQRASVINILEQAGPLAADAGTTLVLEPLNTPVDHPGHFTATAAEGAEIVRAVDEFAGEQAGFAPAQLRLCVGSLEPLLADHDAEDVFRLLHVVTTRINHTGGMGHYHLPVDREHDAVSLLEPLFDALLEVRTRRGVVEQRWHFRDRDASSPWLPV